MPDIWTAFEIGIAFGGLCASILFIGGSVYIRRTRPKTLGMLLFDLFLTMNENEEKTIKITVSKVKRKLKLKSWAVVSDLY